MKLDWKKIRAEIHRNTVAQRVFKKTNGYKHPDLAIYATYMCSVVSAYRGHLHMKWWNKSCDRVLDVKNSGMIDSYYGYGWPNGFKIEFNSLDDQLAFISQLKIYLGKRQHHNITYTKHDPVVYSEFMTQPLDFMTSGDPPTSKPVEMSFLDKVIDTFWKIVLPF